MPAPYNLPLPPNHVIVGGYTIRIDAVNPTTGATVSGVNVSDVHLQVDNTGGTDLTSGDWIPLLIGVTA